MSQFDGSVAHHTARWLPALSGWVMAEASLRSWVMNSLTIVRISLTLTTCMVMALACACQSNDTTSADADLADYHSQSEYINAQAASDEAVDIEEDSMSDLQLQLQAARQRHPFEWVGLSLEKASDYAQEHGLSIQVVKRDGVSEPDAEQSRKQGRINLDLYEGLVLAAHKDHGPGESMQLLEGVTVVEFVPFIGLSEEESKALAEAAGRPWRVRTRDGESQMLTMDYVEERVNAIVVDGQVVAATGG